MAFTAAKSDRNPARSARASPPPPAPLPAQSGLDNRLIIGVERRDATNEQRGAGHSGESGAPVFRSSRTQSTCSRRETEPLGSTSSSAARPSLLRNVRRVSRERSVRQRTGCPPQSW
jgi:hypothetical protein